MWSITSYLYEKRFRAIAVLIASERVSVKVLDLERPG